VVVVELGALVLVDVAVVTAAEELDVAVMLAEVELTAAEEVEMAEVEVAEVLTTVEADVAVLLGLEVERDVVVVVGGALVYTATNCVGEVMETVRVLSVEPVSAQCEKVYAP
jgi:hypothetical protein